MFFTCLSDSGTVNVYDLRCHQPCITSVTIDSCSCMAAQRLASVPAEPPVSQDSDGLLSTMACSSVGSDITGARADSPVARLHECVAAFSGDSALLVSMCTGGDIQLFDARVMKKPVALASNAPVSKAQASNGCHRLQLQVCMSTMALSSGANLQVACYCLCGLGRPILHLAMLVA